jgi:phenylacetate-coenzyme A ligase PaaK-like adenylate-forming protein
MTGIRRDTMETSWPRLGDWSTFDQLAELQTVAAEATLSAARSSRFYGDRLGTDTRLADAPLTTKDDLRAAYPFDLLARPLREVVTYHESSGTTGTPIASFMTAEDWKEWVDRFNRGAARIGPDDRVLVKTPYSMATTAHQMHNAAVARGALVIPAGNRSPIMSYPRVLRLLRDVGVTVTWSLPSEPLLWAAAAWAAGLETTEVGHRLRAMVVAGEVLSEAKRRRIMDLWGVSVVEDYGSTETGSLAGECGAGALHAWADRFHLEVCDPVTGRMSARGRGRLVVTTLYRQAMPLVRYELGDMVELWDEPCTCGWVLPRIRVLGRTLPPGGGGAEGVSQAAVDDVVYSLPVDRRVLFWRGLTTGDGLRLEVEVDPRVAEETTAEVRVAAADRLPVATEVTAVPPGSLVPTEILVRRELFLKPRYLFSSTEDWGRGLIYQE